MVITKSKFVAGVQCLKRLYLLVHDPELAAQPDESEQVIIDQGQEVGLLARQMFPGGVAVESKGREEAVRATRELFGNPEIPAIFEGAFEHEGVHVRVDVLQRRPDGCWRLIEVKSTVDLKDHHIDDVAIQHRVLTNSGVDLKSSCLAHVNRAYVHSGGPVDARRFFRVRNLTRRVKRLQREVSVRLRSEFRVLEMPVPPQIAPGRQCSEPVTCEFYDECNLPIPDDHILRLPRIHAGTVGKLAELGIQSIRDIPGSFPLSDRLRRACTSVQMGTPWFSPQIKGELKRLKYPLYFMDFETVNPCIPRFLGMRPYDQLPFQWSVHVQCKLGAVPDHFEFLATDQSDPRRAFISALCDALGERGSIVVYNQQFESQRLSDLASWLPNFAGRIKKIQRRLWDLLRVIRDYVYHPQFAGSYSLKAVLPALVPSMGYDDMEIADGQVAGLTWESLVHGTSDRGDGEQIKEALLAYCGRDTLGLLALIEKLRDVAAEL